MTRMERQVKFTWLPLNREEEKMMKARYQKPMIEIEKYALDSAIAAGCQTVISLGPGDDIHPICDEYEPDFGFVRNKQMLRTAPLNFYEDSCTCYLSAGVGTLMTS